MSLASSAVVIGAGLAGTQTVAALRLHGFSGHITVVGAEGIPPYDRPPLSKELFSRPGPAWLSDELGADLTTLADEVLLDDEARSIVPGSGQAASTVTTAGGRTLTADVVVVACGATPVRPTGWDAASTLHSAADADRLRARLVPGAHLVCIGAGWIGAELAGAAVAAGCTVTVVEAAAVPLQRQLGKAVGAHLSPWYAAAGVTLLTDSLVDAVEIGRAHV